MTFDAELKSQRLSGIAQAHPTRSSAENGLDNLKASMRQSWCGMGEQRTNSNHLIVHSLTGISVLYERQWGSRSKLPANEHQFGGPSRGAEEARPSNIQHNVNVKFA